jgi:hypothetical protein
MVQATPLHSKLISRAPTEVQSAVTMPIFLKVRIPKKHWKTVPVHLTIVFSEIDRDILHGFIRFGIRRGTLAFHLQEASISFEDNYLVNELKMLIDSEIELTHSDKTAETNKSQGTLSVEKMQPNLSINGEVTSQYESASGCVRKLKETLHVVSVGGKEASPSWTFESKGTSQILVGGCVDRKMALLKAHNETCSMQTGFTIYAKDLLITHRDGFLAKCLSVGKQKILKLLVLKGRRRLGNKYCLCEGELITGKRYRGGVVECL